MVQSFSPPHSRVPWFSTCAMVGMAPVDSAELAPTLCEKTFNIKLSGKEVYYKIFKSDYSRSCSVVNFITRKF